MKSQDQRPALIKTLNGLLEREYNSIVKYLLTCEPWMPPEHEMWLKDLLQELATEDSAHAERIVRLILSLEGSPLIGHYTKDVVELSYLSINHCLARAVEWKQALITQYETAREACAEWPEIAGTLTTIRNQETAHQARLLEALSRVRPPGRETPPPEATGPDDSSASPEKNS